MYPPCSVLDLEMLGNSFLGSDAGSDGWPLWAFFRCCWPWGLPEYPRFRCWTVSSTLGTLCFQTSCLGRCKPFLLEFLLVNLMRLAQRKRVMISLIHSLIRASVEDLGCLDYLLLDKIARPNSISSVVLNIFNIEVYSNALYYLWARTGCSHLNFDTFIPKRWEHKVTLLFASS
jgi:hypothetical protein